MGEQDSQIKIAIWVLVLAVVFLVCAAFVAVMLAYDLFAGRQSITVEGILNVVLGAYLLVLFAYVAFTGLTPPKRLFPLGNAIWPKHS